MTQRIHKTTPECDLSFLFPYSSGRLKALNFSEIPIIMHSNGTVCWEATDYILYRFQKNIAIAKSTLNSYARQLSRAIHFLDYNRLSLGQLNDTQIFSLVDYLQCPDHSKTRKPSNNNQVNSILSRLFDMLIFLRNTNRLPKLIISDDPSIHAQINVTAKFSSTGVSKRVRYLSHPAKLPSKNVNRRFPILNETIDKLIEGISKHTKNSYIQERWYVLLLLLEHTGAREEEISNIRITDIFDCKQQVVHNRTPRLRVTTHKGKNKGKIREIPIAPGVLNEVYHFIEFQRSRIIAKAIKSKRLKRDHKFLFTTSTGQNKLTGKRISDHFSEVRKGLSISGSDACPHMFRHRFITIHVRERLKEYLKLHGGYTSGIEDFIVKKVKILTGHASDSSLLHYVDDAFDELDTVRNMELRLNREFDHSAIDRKKVRLITKGKSATNKEEKAAILDQLIQLEDQS